MKYTPTDVCGVTIVDIEPDRDDRGFFSHLFCANEFDEHGLLANVARIGVAYNYARGTLRGIHRQVPPNVEAKLVRCTRGAIVAVAVDVRPESSNYGDHVMVQLSADNRRALYLAARSLRTVSRLSLTTPKFSTRSAVSTKPKNGRDSAGTTRNSGSTGRWR